MIALPTTPRLLDNVALVLGVTAVVISMPRWLRVAQREHYIVKSVTRFAVRFWTLKERPINLVLFVAALASVELQIRSGLGVYLRMGLLAIPSAVAIFLPWGLGLRGRTSKLVWTARLRRLALVSLVVSGTGLGVMYVLAFLPGLAAVALLMPLAVDVSMAILARYERRSLSSFVGSASTKLQGCAPRVVAVTGSFGKTTTKNLIAGLCSGTFETLASPHSYNNRAGLARTVNENLTESVELLIAEMGAFQPGEIAELCGWVQPEIAVITALGPVHLERFGSEEAILKAKMEITETAKAVVICIDYPRLALAANELSLAGKKVWRVSGSNFMADIAVKENEEGDFIVYSTQRRIGSLRKSEIPAGNLASAVAVALELGVGEEEIAARLGTLHPPANRLNLAIASSGVEVLDDTYNSNPTGARHALQVLSKRATPGKRVVVVTPGMVELGDRQFSENFQLGAIVAGVATDLLVVGLTNRKALIEGATSILDSKAKGPNIVALTKRDEAVSWVRSNLKPGDIVLYENDLPDHYP